MYHLVAITLKLQNKHKEMDAYDILAMLKELYKRNMLVQSFSKQSSLNKIFWCV